ncbi:MAG: hypothetical protein WC966_11065 [Bradymonadales bacterium]|jgi:hypothetical protein
MSTVQFIKILADLSVAGEQHMMPPNSGWKAPQEAGEREKDNYVTGVGDPNWGLSTNANGIISYFNTQDPHLYHVTSSAANTLAYKAYVYTMIDATNYAFNLWKPELHFKDLKINGPVAVGKKGCLKEKKGSFFKYFKSYPGHMSIAGGKHFTKWRDAVGKGVGSCLSKYVKGVIVPGIPWYPAFAAFPAPVAPPMPNIPYPLIALPSLGLNDIVNPDKLKAAMLKEFPSNLKQACKDDSDSIHETLFGAIANTLSVGFMIWVATQTVNLVMGQGQIPSFAPPAAPVGPVVNGTNIPTPGHLMP